MSSSVRGVAFGNRIVPVKRVVPLIVLAAVSAAGCSRSSTPANPLIPASTTMVTAWQVPLDPLKGPLTGDAKLTDQIKWGYRIFVDTPREAARFTGGKVACANCHLNAGQRERALPVVGVAGMFPEYNNRAARLISLADRVVDCFMRSENATGHGDADLPSPTSKEVLAVNAYLTWLARGYTVGTNPPWRGRNAIAADKLVPVPAIDIRAGEMLYAERCVSCHGLDGQGVQIGDKKPGPLWGPGSWNDGAGAARVYTLAGIIRYTMPYLDPGSLSDADAQHVAAFITAQERPVYPFKSRDYAGGKIPADAVYYRGVTSSPTR
jgi:thiosulfate dehydrogenase